MSLIDKNELIKLNSKIKNQQNKQFAEELLVRIDKQLLDETSEFHLDVDEFYIYFLLNANERRNGTIKTNFYLLKQEAILKSGSKKFDEYKIIEVLYKLFSKKIIQIDKSLFTTKNNKIIPLDEDKFFQVKINHQLLEESSFKKKGEWKGFVQVPYSIINKITRVEHLYIYCVVFMYNDKYRKGFVCPYYRWSDILGKSTRTIKRHIQEMVDLKIIFVNIGDYIQGSRVRQKVNTYQVKEFKNKTNATINKEKHKIRKEIEQKPKAFDVNEIF